MNEVNETTVLTELNSLYQAIVRLSANPDDKELTPVVDELSRQLRSAFQTTDGADAGVGLEYWQKIFAQIAEAKLTHAISRQIDETSFFEFGSCLRDHAEDVEGAGRSLIHDYLNLFRQSPFLVRLRDHRLWETLIHDLIEKSHFTVGKLIDQRIRDYGQKLIFRILKPGGEENYSWYQLADQINVHACGLAALFDSGDSSGKVAFLMENSITMVFLDLACLCHGWVNVMIPANSVPEHIEFILNQTRAAVLLVSNEKQLVKIKPIKKNCPYLQQVVLIEGSSMEPWVISLQDMLSRGQFISDHTLRSRKENVHIHDLATIMYTSGTTGDPKGIMFSQMNLIYKRFCRAMALPLIGADDRFLCYLPLYHTFGRWLEMLGSIFWGGQYIFMENPALATMLDNMQRVQPTVFISIPKKWIELYEYIGKEIDIESANPEEIRSTVKQISGGSLTWALSAAGYLDVEVFRFFQENGIELMSGFGMTEATGGITMTPPGQYRPGSIGKPLPGIECRLADDGELLIRGPYVMTGYYGLPGTESPFTDGWLPTGDIMRMDKNGFFEIIDRKKEIYKNIRGETIAPQKIENLFRDFESVAQVFVVGDHKPYNTVLIFPNEATEQSILRRMTPEEKENYFASVVVTINKFLAPFERIVDFRLIDRPFSAENGELTPKGTYKRKVIERNFATLIRAMYQKPYISLYRDALEIRIPNWFLREKGCLSSDFQINKRGLLINKYRLSLMIRSEDDSGILRIGDFLYHIQGKILDLQTLFVNPNYWLGNQPLVDFCGESIAQWYRHDVQDQRIALRGLAEHQTMDESRSAILSRLSRDKEYSLMGLHLAVCHLQSPDPEQFHLGLDYLVQVSRQKTALPDNMLAELCRRYFLVEGIQQQRELFKLGLSYYMGSNVGPYLQSYMQAMDDFLDEALITFIVHKMKGEEFLTAVHALVKDALFRKEKSLKILKALFCLMAEFGIQHPTKYKRARQLLVRYMIQGDNQIAPLAAQSRSHLEKGFRHWLGDKKDVAVDAETGIEYYWEEVITFEEDIAEDQRHQIVEIIRDTALLREAIFLFTEGRIVRLYDIPPRGIWISRLQDLPYKTIYRLSVQTRHYGAYDISLHHLKQPITPEIIDEITWMIHAGAPRRGLRLVEEFGGFWEQYGCWTQEYLPADTVGRFIQRTLRRDKENGRNLLFHIWPFFIWTAMVAHLSFWKRSEFQIELQDKSIHNIVIPWHDYQTGQRFLSIAQRKKSSGIFRLMRDFYEQFIINTQKEYSFLERPFICRYIFNAVLDVHGDAQGLTLLKEALQEMREQNPHCQDDNLTDLLEQFIKEIEDNGFIPKNLFFAILRFHRWLELNQSAEYTAQARTINELYDTYQLHLLEERYPETRARFLLETVFSSSSSALRQRLKGIVLQQHRQKLSAEQMLELYSALAEEIELNDQEQYFLSRLSYPHLRPTDSAQFVADQSEGLSPDVVVRFEDEDGTPFWIRKPATPREISRLHTLFLDNNLPVIFRPEHRFLIVVSERGHVVAGLFYSYTDEKTAYLEKIVVSARFRRKGMSEHLMHEFFNRLQGERIQQVTTGFFRPEYFYRFGFRIERKYAGLVKELQNK